ncbi:hypothetical protein AUK45_04805 [Candidatus Peregrinibacteria bacterium CG2_30_44_17]|nr:MAG: hypothetical protein AUK45_04805 [Candidatus Peregrinibacteria bacterium CG2_30_44_17]
MLKRLKILVLTSILLIHIVAVAQIANASIFSDYEAAVEACNGDPDCEDAAADAADAAEAEADAAAAAADAGAAAEADTAPALDEDLTVDDVTDGASHGEIDNTEAAAEAQDNLDSMEDATDNQESADAVKTVMPSIPKPDFLPGPSEGADQASIQTYFREQAIPDFIAGFIGVIGLVSFVAIIVAGIQFLTAYGNEERVGAAKKNLIYAILGFVIAILSYSVVSILGSLNLESAETSMLNIPIAHAAVTDESINSLLPTQEVLIEASPNAQGSSLVSGDLAEDIIPNAINIALYLVSSLILVALVYSGILLVIGQGNEETITKAKNIIIYAVVGLITVAISYAVIYGIAKLKL